MKILYALFWGIMTMLVLAFFVSGFFAVYCSVTQSKASALWLLIPVIAGAAVSIVAYLAQRE